MSLSKIDKKKLADPNWRLDTLYKIKNKDKQIVRFRKNQIQQLLDSNSTRFDNVLKPRQVGISTYYLLKKLDAAAFNKNYTAAILSHKRDSMQLLFDIIRRAHKHMHPLVQPRLDKGGGSKYCLRFPAIDSKIYCTMEAVSDTVNDLHVSEMALMDNDDRVKTSMDSVPLKDGIISVETTPRAFNHYYDFWSDPESIFKNHFFPWFLQKEYQIESEPLKYTDEEKLLIKYAKKHHNIKLTHNQIAYRRFKIKQKGSFREFIQEFAENDTTCFLSSGDSFLDTVIVKSLMDETVEPITEDGPLIIYKKWKKGHKYVCGCDTAEGVGGDYSVASIYDVTDMEQVAELRGHIKPADFAHEINKMCKLYYHAKIGWPLLGVERNNHGHAVLLELEDHIIYPNLYKHKDERVGWVTDRVSKPIMLNDFREGLENKTIKLNSKLLLTECLTLVNNNGKIEAATGKYDDCIIASAIALQMCIKSQSLNFYDDINNHILL